MDDDMQNTGMHGECLKCGRRVDLQVVRRTARPKEQRILLFKNHPLEEGSSELCDGSEIVYDFAPVTPS